MIQLIVYDLDGTLIDSKQDIAEAVNWTLDELGLVGGHGRTPLSMERISSFVGNGVTSLMRQVLEEVGTPRAVSLPHAIKLFRRRYGEHLLDHTRLYPSVRKVLEFYRARKQAVITNKPEDFSRRILRALGIDSFFFRILGGDSGFPKKPAPEALVAVLKEAGVSREEAVLVGDSAMDVETGKNAGIQTAAVTYGFGSREEIEAAQPDFILEDLGELIGDGSHFPISGPLGHKSETNRTLKHK